MHAPKSKKSIPQWQLRDMETYHKMYPEKVTDSVLKHERLPNINTREFWKYAFKNIILGYMLKYVDKYKRIGGMLKRL